MPRIPAISEAEARVMQVLWARSPLTAAQIIEGLDAQSSWKPQTIKTLIARLVSKGVVGFEKDGKAYRYRPLVEQETFRRAQRKTFLRRFYGGALRPMLAAFIEEENLTAEDLAELRQMLDRKERKQP
ncbi:MAG: transcriptional regulator [Phycisphaerae bacterium]